MSDNRMYLNNKIKFIYIFNELIFIEYSCSKKWERELSQYLKCKARSSDILMFENGIKNHHQKATYFFLMLIVFNGTRVRQNWTQNNPSTNELQMLTGKKPNQIKYLHIDDIINSSL